MAHRVVAATITELVFRNCLHDYSDLIFHLWPVAVCNLIVENLSITTACIPYLKPFIQSLESGMLRTDDLRRRGLSTAPGSESNTKQGHQLENLSSPFKPMFPNHQTKPQQSAAITANSTGFPEQHATTITSARGGRNNQHGWDTESQKSSSRMIKQTRSWTVER